MTSDKLTTITIDPAIPARASVICLHGLGADGYDLQPVAAQLALPAELAVRFLFPHAPYRPVAINNGYSMRAWYDITQRDLQQEIDDAGLHAAERLVGDLIDAEVEQGIAAERIVLAGFSQGGALALHTGLRYAQRLAGIIALSAYLPLPSALHGAAALPNKSLSIMLAHGAQDSIIPLAAARTARTVLQELGYDIAWHVYPMGHGIGRQELADIAAWLCRRLN